MKTKPSINFVTKFIEIMKLLRKYKNEPEDLKNDSALLIKYYGNYSDQLI